jgi:Protein of unknown function (DUF3617)
MRKTHIRTTIGCCILAVAAIAWAQGPRAGLYDFTSTTTWQQSPFPAGVNPMGAGPRTGQVCISQEQIDKYNGAPPQTRGDCELSNVVKSATGYSADVSCGGAMQSKGTVVSTWDGQGHAKTKLHLAGLMHGKPLEFTTEGEQTYKSADCGSVKPLASK